MALLVFSWLYLLTSKICERPCIAKSANEAVRFPVKSGSDLVAWEEPGAAEPGSLRLFGMDPSGMTEEVLVVNEVLLGK